MANPNEKLELVIEVNDNQANIRIQNINKLLESVSKQAAQTSSKSTKSVDDMTASFKKLGEHVQNFARDPLGAVQNGIDGLLTKMGPLAVGVGTVATGLIAGSVAAYKFAESIAESNEQLQNLAYSTGMTVERVQALQLAGKLSGLGDLTGKIEALNIQLGRGEGDFVDAIKKAGLSMSAGKESLDYLEELRERFINIENPSERAQKAVAILGRRLIDLVPILVNDKENFIAMIREIENGGAVMSQKTVDDIAKLDRKLDDHTITWAKFTTKIKEAVVALHTMDYKMVGGVPIPRAPEARRSSKASSAKSPGYVAGTPIKVEWEPGSFEQLAEEERYKRIKDEQEYEKSLNARLAARRIDWDAYIKPIVDSKMELLRLDQAIREILKPNDVDEFLLNTTDKDLVNRRQKEADDSIKEVSASMQDMWDIQRDYARDRIAEIRDSAGHIFDDLMSGSKDIWRDLLNTFKNIFLAPVRMAFQNIAVGLFSGMGGGAQGGGGGLGGIFGGLKSLVMGGGATGGMSGGAAPSGGMASFASSLGIPTAASAIGGTAAGASSMAFLTGFFTNPWTIGIGAAIGAGFLLKKLFGESPEDKMKKKVKAAYGVEIKDKGVLRQLVEMAKQGFGGNFDMAIRSTQARDLIQLYADTTGQKVKGMPARMTPTSITQSGGRLFENTSYSNGIAQPLSGGSLSSGLGGVSLAGATSAPIVVNISVPGAKQFFENETMRVVVQNPRAVQSAALSATKSNAGRRELTSLQLAPGTLTS